VDQPKAKICRIKWKLDARINRVRIEEKRLGLGLGGGGMIGVQDDNRTPVLSEFPVFNLHVRRTERRVRESKGERERERDASPLPPLFPLKETFGILVMRSPTGTSWLQMIRTVSSSSREVATPARVRSEKCERGFRGSISRGEGGGG
jgi:hypothetical protein